MAKPDTFMSRLRMWLAKALDPRPNPGEGWCVRCSLNDGHTKIISGNEAAMQLHAHLHSPAEIIRIIITGIEKKPEADTLADECEIRVPLVIGDRLERLGNAYVLMPTEKVTRLSFEPWFDSFAKRATNFDYAYQKFPQPHVRMVPKIAIEGKITP